jgi:EmrB/QacA subfamily drug resistance transporter
MGDPLTANLPHSSRSPLYALATVSVATFMMVLDSTVVIVALPAIQEQFASSFYRLELVLVVYVVAQGSLVLLAGYLCDRYGRRRLFGLGVIGLGIASFACGLSPSIDALILARGLEGAASAFVFGAGLALLNAETPLAGRPRSFAIWGAALGAGVAAGPILGGIVVTLAGWPWVFFINVPIAAAVAAVTFLRVGESVGPKGGRWDLPGSVLFIGLAATAMVAAERGPNAGWGSPWVIALLVAAASCGIGFVVRERTAITPMFDLTLFRRRGFQWGTLGTVVIALSYWSIFAYFPPYFEKYLGYSPLEAGIALLPIAVTSVATSLMVGRWAGRWGSSRLFRVGWLIVVMGGLLVWVAPAGSSAWVLAPGLFLVGAGSGLYQSEISRAAIAAAPEGEAGVASAMNSTFRALSVSFAWAGAAVLFGATVTASFLARIGGGPIDATGLASRLIAKIIPGDFAQGAQLLPDPLRPTFEIMARASYYDGIHAIVILTIASALVGLLLSYAIGPVKATLGVSPR